jgi:hypothetical protein
MSTEDVLESSAASMTDEEIREFLTEQGVGVLALSTDGVPYVVPMSFGFDGDSTLYFLFLLFGTESRKQTLSDRTERARFLVYRARSMHDWRSVSLVGHIEQVPEDDWDPLQVAMENAWHPNLFSSASPMRGVEGYQFRVDDWNGIRHEP